MLQLRLFGAPRVERDGAPFPFRRTRALALLAYLALTGQPQEREQLTALLWPEFDEASARNNLRRELSMLRSALGDELLDAGRQQVAWAGRGRCEVDALAFAALLDAVAAHPHGPEALCEACAASATQAAALATDELLAGFSLADSPAFDEWLLFRREELRRRLDGLLAALSTWHGGRGEHSHAIGYAHRRLALDPLSEPARRELMRLCAVAGQQAVALRHYEDGARLLAAELGVEPEPETTALYEAIRARELGPPRPQRPPAVDGADISPTRVRNLPALHGPTVGREAVIAEITGRLADPSCRLLTLTGPPGIGKTRLAQAAAEAALPGLAHGAAFIGAAALSDPALLAPAILEALGTPLLGGDPWRQLSAQLRERELLLVIDDGDQLGEGGRQLADLLAAGPRLKLLCTAREPTGATGEWLYAVQGLTCPPLGADTAQNAEGAYGAVELFVALARRAHAAFAPGPTELAAIGRLCRLLDGMPLGLELAAPWVQAMSCAEIADEVASNLDFLSAALPHLPPRHHSLRAAYEQTWRRLGDDERAALVRLSVLRGGFLREAAARVAHAALPVLQALAVRALIRRDERGRYTMHELVRQLALEQLQADEGEHRAQRARHSAYYLDFLAARTHGVRGERHPEAIRAIVDEADNIRAAWEWAAAHPGDDGLLERAALCLWEYFDLRCAYDEGEAAFHQAAEAVARRNGPPALQGLLQVAQGHLHARRAPSDEGVALIRRGITLLKEAFPDDPGRVALPLVALGFVFLGLGQHSRARACGREALPAMLDAPDLWGLASCLLLLGTAALEEGHIAESRYFFDECHAACRRGDIRAERFHTNYFLLRVALAQGDYVKAVQCVADTGAIRPAIQGPRPAASVYRQRGLLAMTVGDLDEAVDCLRRSVAIWADHGMQPSALMRQLAGALRVRGDLDEAYELLLQCLSGALAAGNMPEAAECLHGLGCTSLARRQPDRAEEFYRQSIAIWEQRGNETKAAEVRTNLAFALVERGCVEEGEAAELLRQALPVHVSQGLTPLLLEVCVGIGRLFLELGHVERAGELLAVASGHPAASKDLRTYADWALALLPPLPPARGVSSGAGPLAALLLTSLEELVGNPAS